MNLLYLCHRIPYPPDKGDKIRSFHQIKYLSRTHRVHVGCLIDAEKDRAHVDALMPYCASLDTAWRGTASARLRAAWALLGSESLSVAAFRSADLLHKIERRLKTEAIDAAVVFSSVMAQYVPPAAGIPTIVDYCDVDSEKWRVYSRMRPWPLSWLYRTEADRLLRHEKRVAETCDEAVFVAEWEADVFRRAAGGARASALLNGVDVEFFSRQDGSAGSGDGQSIVFVGLMDYFPNVDAVSYFVGEIFPRILDQSPGAVFRIVGRNPSRRVRDLARHRNVEVIGEVPDVRPYFAQAALSVAPFRIARGVQTKVLESMSMQVPVVGTTVAFQGITAGPDDGLSTVDSPEAFASAVTEFLRDPAKRLDAGRRGRRFVEQHHLWRDHAATLNALLEDVVGRRAGKVPSAGGRR